MGESLLVINERHCDRGMGWRRRVGGGGKRGKKHERTVKDEQSRDAELLSFTAESS